jgi:hypothetical protein
MIARWKALFLSCNRLSSVVAQSLTQRLGYCGSPTNYFKIDLLLSFRLPAVLLRPSKSSSPGKVSPSRLGLHEKKRPDVILIQVGWF